MRNALYEGSLLPRIVHDIKYLLGDGAPDSADDDAEAQDHVGLWDDKLGEVQAGFSYGKETDDADEIDDEFGTANM